MIISLVLVQNLFQIYYFIVVFLLRQFFLFYRPELHFVRQKANSKSEIFLVYYLYISLEEEDGSLLLQITFAKIYYIKFYLYFCIVVITLVLLRYLFLMRDIL